jgi:hypothetical protein
MRAKLSSRDKWIYGSGHFGFSITNTVFWANFTTVLIGVLGLTSPRRIRRVPANTRHRAMVFR